MNNGNTPVTFDGNLFTWTGTAGVAKSSSLGLDGKWWPHVIRVRSHRTGKEVGFVFTGGRGNIPGMVYNSTNVKGINLIISTR